MNTPHALIDWSIFPFPIDDLTTATYLTSLIFGFFHFRLRSQRFQKLIFLLVWSCSGRGVLISLNFTLGFRSRAWHRKWSSQFHNGNKRRRTTSTWMCRAQQWQHGTIMLSPYSRQREKKIERQKLFFFFSIFYMICEQKWQSPVFDALRQKKWMKRKIYDWLKWTNEQRAARKRANRVGEWKRSKRRIKLKLKKTDKRIKDIRSTSHLKIRNFLRSTFVLDSIFGQKRQITFLSFFVFLFYGCHWADM